MALTDNQEQMVYDALHELLQESGVVNRDTAPSLMMLVSIAGEYSEYLRTNGDSRDKLIQECFDALERRHADDFVDALKERYGMEG